MDLIIIQKIYMVIIIFIFNLIALLPFILKVY